MRRKTDVIGVEDVIDLLKEVENVSIRVVTRAAKAGASIPLKAAKSKCPVSIDGNHGNPPGTLKKDLRLKLEKKRTKGKRVYTVGPGSKGWYAHFADSGYTDRQGRFHPGNKFLRNAADQNRRETEQTILETMADGLKKVR